MFYFFVSVLLISGFALNIDLSVYYYNFIHIISFGLSAANRLQVIVIFILYSSIKTNQGSQET